MQHIKLLALALALAPSSALASFFDGEDGCLVEITEKTKFLGFTTGGGKSLGNDCLPFGSQRPISVTGTDGKTINLNVSVSKKCKTKVELGPPLPDNAVISAFSAVC
ncbi:hypothetical protein ACKVWC_000165 [Pyricularia oryzae]